ncbi:hypothetical protein FUA23_15050 [Neolewinella aurantiaca]|uniref:Uncharacterized protein n=1 Tax=Neolewinella aurantiaca TaxID=2602767 RepID=A0A5C7FFE4_9BACT|nr:hypothetical protein [Neolewinella aurantiaca]TXF88295.1 hypothetical protein FUA23_15050 [Neolewinella aurantiaca]
MRPFLSLLLLTILSTCVSAQIGLHPPTIDFQQIRSDHARIIFPKGYETRAMRVASLIDELQANHTRSIGEKIFDVDLILQTATTEINGYVGLGPFRSEFYATPPQQLSFLSNTEWLDLLTIHEYRHVQQNSNERRGITKLFSWLQGENGWSVFSFLATPNWFSEGDAVVYETALSGAGRGRTPAFSATLRSLLDEDIIYPYAKSRNGSYRSLVPDHYRYGYSTLTYARERFGNDVWKSVLHDGAAYKGLIYPFGRALKKKTGYKPAALYKAALLDLKAKQDSALAARGPLVEGVAFGDASEEIRNYKFPAINDEGRVVALRTAFKHTPALVVVSAEGEKDEKLTSVGIQREPYVHVRGNLAVWMENRVNPRYTNERFSEIILYDMKSGRKKQLTEKGKYFSPSLSFDRRRIVAVEHAPLEGPPAIAVLESNTGAVAAKFKVDAQSVSFPRFSPDGKTVYFYDVGFDGVALRSLELETGKTRLLEERNHEPRDYLQVTGDGNLIMSSGRDGVDNVYLLEPETGQRRQLTNLRIGGAYPFLSPQGYLYYAEATPKGERLRRLALREENKSNSALRVVSNPAGPNIFERPAAFSAETENLTQNVVLKDYPVSDFNDKLGGVKLHSWSFNGSYVNPGFEVAAANALNTVGIGAGVYYNIDERRTSTGLNVDYGGWYPVLSLGVNSSGRTYNTLDAGRDTLILRGYDFNQQRFSLGARVPLTWIRGDFQSQLTPALSVGYVTTSDSELTEAPDGFSDLSFSVSGSYLHRTAYQQVQPRAGVAARLAYASVLSGTDGSRLLFQSSLYLPGLFPTHGFKLDFDVQAENSANTYSYPNAFNYARGYGRSINDRVVRIGANYQLPLAYPDFGIAGITYFQRIRLNAFYDYSRLAIEDVTLTRPDVSSVGGQLYFDNVWLNSALITVGVQVAYLPDAFPGQAKTDFRLLFSGGF